MCVVTMGLFEVNDALCYTQCGNTNYIDEEKQVNVEKEWCRFVE